LISLSLAAHHHSLLTIDGATIDRHAIERRQNRRADMGDSTLNEVQHPSMPELRF
jgi:hypothetical protein